MKIKISHAGRKHFLIFAVFSLAILFLSSAALATSLNQTNTSVYIRGGNGTAGFNNMREINASHNNISQNKTTSFTCNVDRCNFTVILSNENYTAVGSFLNLSGIQNATIYFNASDNTWRNISDMVGLGFGAWNVSNNTLTKWLINYSVAGGDGYDYGIRDVYPTGSYWLDENGTSLETGLVGYWKFSEGIGSVTNDSSGNGNNGTLFNTPSWFSGSNCRFGSCLNFTGTNTYVLSALNPSYSGITISAWINSSTVKGTIVSSDVPQSTNNGIALSFEAGSPPYFQFFAGNGVTNINEQPQTALLTTNNWHHVVATYSSIDGKVKLYVDGTNFYTATYSTFGSISAGVGKLSIGRRQDDAGYFAGQIDEFRIYSRALSQDEITRLYKSTSVELKTDFVSAKVEPYVQLNLTNGTDGTVFYNLAENILVDNVSLTTLYPVNASMLYFFDWKDNDWKIWQKNNYAKYLAGWWRTDDADGTSVTDFSYNGNTGTTNGTTWNTSSNCRIAGCLSFNGAADFKVSDSGTLNSLGTGTFSLWFKPDYSGTPGSVKGLFSKSSTAATIALYGAYHFTDGNLYLHLNGGSAINLGSWSPVAGNWYHLTFTWDGANAKSYVNGAILGTSSTASGSGSNTRPFFVGAYVFNSEVGMQFASGSIDDAKLWTRALTAEEIKAEYENSKRGMPDWLDPRFKQTFKWRQTFYNNKTNYPSLNITYLLTAHDPFVRIFVDARNSSGTENHNVTIPVNFGQDKTRSYMKLAGISNGWNEQVVASANPWFAMNDSVGFVRTDGVTEADWTNSSMFIFVNRAAGDQPLFLTHNFQFGKGKHPLSQIRVENFSSTTQFGKATYFYAFNSSLSNSFMFSMGYPGTVDTSTSCDGVAVCPWIQLNPWQFSNETIEQVANSTLTYYDLSDNKLVGWWRFNENNNTIVDHSGFNNTGTGQSGVQIITNSSCKSGFGYCADFDGVNDQVAVRDGAGGNYFTLTNDFTYSLWVYPRDSAGAPNYGLVSIDPRAPNGIGTGGGSSTNESILILNAETTPYFEGFGSSLSSGVTVGFNTWSHVAITMESGFMRIFINGEQKATKQFAQTKVTNPLLIGQIGDGASYFNGMMDNVKIYSRGLSPEEVKADYLASADSYPNWQKSGNTTATNVTHAVPTTWNYDGGAAGVWRFEEGSGNNATDSSGNFNIGTLGIATAGTQPTWITNSSCKFGNCLFFDGSNDVVEVVHKGSFSISDKISFGMWFNSAGTANTQLFHKASNVWGIEYFNNKARCVVDVGGAKVADSITTLLPSKWYHVMCVYDGGNLRIYLDGRDETDTAATGSITTNTNNVIIGASNNAGASAFNGYIDEVRIYPRALANYEVWEQYSREVSKYYDEFNTIANSNSGRYRLFGVEDANVTNLQPVTPNATLLHVRFNDNSTTNVTDVSGNGNNGASLNGAAWMYNSTCNANFGGCMFFDGSNDYATAGNSSAFRAMSNFSVGAWVKTTASAPSSSLAGIVTKSIQRVEWGLYESGPGTASGVFYITNSNGNLQTAVTTTGINDGKWHHLVGTYDGGTMIIYLDGVQSASSTQAGPTNSTIDEVRIGGLPPNGVNNYFFNGYIDEALVVNRALTASEVYQLYLGGYNRTIGGRWHRVASADGIPYTSYNITTSRTDAEQGYSQFKFLVTGINYITQAGNPMSWTWRVPVSGDFVKTGAPYDWSWKPLVDGSGRKIPKGTPISWVWGDE